MYHVSLIRCRTIALETGFQNSQLCSTIVQLSFSPAELEVMFAFPLIYSIFQLVVAVTFVGSKRLPHTHTQAVAQQAMRTKRKLQVFDKKKMQTPQRNAPNWLNCHKAKNQYLTIYLSGKRDLWPLCSKLFPLNSPLNGLQSFCDSFCGMIYLAGLIYWFFKC